MYKEFLESFDAKPLVEGTVQYEVDNGVAVVVIANGDARNALTLRMWAQIESIFRELAERRDLRAVVLRGTGTAAFAAGADISEFPDTRLSAVEASNYNAQLSRALRTVAAMEIPTLAMIRGFAVGGGCELAAACDLRIGTDDVRIGIPIGKLGVILGLTESRLLIRHVGVHGLKRMLFSGKLFGAHDCLRMGLLDEVVPTNELAAAVDELLTAIVTSSAVTMAAAKVVTDLSTQMDDHAADRVSQFLIDAYDGDDLKEGVAAFLQKRRPVFGKGA